MSTQETDIREGSVRVALGDCLRENWKPANALGYDPNVGEDDPTHLRVSLGIYDEDTDPPHMALRDVSEIAEGSAGYSAIKATGEGPIQTFRGRVDINVFTGADGELPGGEHPQLAAKRIGLEAREIIHDNVQGVMDAATGELLVTDIACSRPRVAPDPDLTPTSWIGRLEVTYRLDEQPPNR